MRTKIKAFTLVELIVVITILAILGTLAFVSFQGYAMQSRDTTRISDMKTITKAIEFYALDSGSFPNTSSGTDIEYQGHLLWNQGIFGEETMQEVKRISEIPLDPESGLPYAYSLSSNRLEYQLAGLFEGNSVVRSIIPFGYANSREGIAYLAGKYNGKIAQARNAGDTYIIEAPSMIVNDVSQTDIQVLAGSGNFVLPGYKNLAAHLSTDYNIQAGGNLLGVNPDHISVFSGAIDSLISNETNQNSFIDNLEQAYSGTIMSQSSQLSSFLGADKNTQTKRTKLVYDMLKNGFAIEIQEISGN